MTIDIIIPVYKPDKSFLQLIDEITSQTLPVGKIIVMNVEQKFYDRLMYSSKLTDEHKNLEVHHISKREFDLGRTKNAAVKISNADYFLVLSQYILPVASDLLKKLVNAIEADPQIAVAYPRQITAEDAPEYEKYMMRYFYPEDSFVRDARDIEGHGWGAYFSSNMCALYKRSIFDELGGFLNHVLCCEDIIYASKAINEGYRVSYVSDATVVNTFESDEKNYARRMFDFSVSIAKHPEIFAKTDVRGEIKKLEKMTMAHLRHAGFRSELFEYNRYVKAGRRAMNKGAKYKRLSYTELAKCSANPEYWHTDEILRDRSSVDAHSGYGRSQAEVEMISKPPVIKKSEE